MILENSFLEKKTSFDEKSGDRNFYIEGKIFCYNGSINQIWKVILVDLLERTAAAATL